MTTKQEYLATILDEVHRNRFEEIFKWVEVKYPTLSFKIAWNQPMYTDHDTFIIGFSSAKQHIAVSPEIKGIQMFLMDIEEAGYTHGSNIFRIKWSEDVKYTVLEKVIDFNIKDKADCTTFWRK